MGVVVVVVFVVYFNVILNIHKFKLIKSEESYDTRDSAIEAIETTILIQNLKEKSNEFNGSVEIDPNMH